MKQTSYKPMLDNSLNLTNHSFLELGFDFSQSDAIKNNSIFHLDEADISLLNALNINKTTTPNTKYMPPPQPKVEVSKTLKDIDDLLTRLKPMRESNQAQNPLPSVKNVKINSNYDINSNKIYSNSHISSPVYENMQIRGNFQKNSDKDYFNYNTTSNATYSNSHISPPIYENMSIRGNTQTNSDKSNYNYERNSNKTNKDSLIYENMSIRANSQVNSNKNNYNFERNSNKIVNNSLKFPPVYENRSLRGNDLRKGVNYLDIPFINNDSFNDRKTSEKWVPIEKDLEVFLMERNLKLKQILKNFYCYLDSFDSKMKHSSKFKIFSSIYKYYLSIVSNDGNSIGLYCDVRQIEKYLGEFMESLGSELIDVAIVKMWVISIRGLLIAKEKHNKIKTALKLGGQSENNLSMTANSLTYGNEMESIENIESEEEYDESEEKL